MKRLAGFHLQMRLTTSPLNYISFSKSVTKSVHLYKYTKRSERTTNTTVLNRRTQNKYSFLRTGESRANTAFFTGKRRANTTFSLTRRMQSKYSFLNSWTQGKFSFFRIVKRRANSAFFEQVITSGKDIQQLRVTTKLFHIMSVKNFL